MVPAFTGGVTRQRWHRSQPPSGLFFVLGHEQPTGSGFSFRKTHLLWSGFRIDLKDSCYRVGSSGGVPRRNSHISAPSGHRFRPKVPEFRHKGCTASVRNKLGPKQRGEEADRG